MEGPEAREEVRCVCGAFVWWFFVKTHMWACFALPQLCVCFWVEGNAVQLGPEIEEELCRQGCILLSISNLAKETAYSSHQVRGELRALLPNSSPFPHVQVRKESSDCVFLECQFIVWVRRVQPSPCT